MKRCMVGFTVAAFALIGVGGEAGAGQPVVQACVGTTFSGAAHTLRELGAPPGAMGSIVSTLAQDPVGPPGLGTGIQYLQAGLTPDEVTVNTCND